VRVYNIVIESYNYKILNYTLDGQNSSVVVLNDKSYV